MEGSTNLNPDLGPLMEAASEFSSYPGLQNDESVKNFLDRFPLPVVFGALEREENEWTLVDCLDRIFKTRHGASLIPHYMIYYLLENAHDGDEHAIQLIIEYGLYPLLLRNLIDGNEVVAAAATEAIKNLAQFPKGISLIFPVNLNDAVHLKNAAAHCSSLALMI
ncbi:hypothetical protein QJS10_CPB20g01791 [Acorus calamus]|uniref:ARM repeat superfamily protein n=1 Tax=Acorus calamus TaxID=4465 RepID=A0AAV9CAL5_ACOCL|nr:hypothetical protein QJS10_CPB20g01791 [Acorus calamus]